MGRKTRHTNAQVAAMMEEINEQTDRGAAVIAAAALDELLNVCIQNRLIEMSRERYDALFGADRPLGSFSAKIEMGAALGFYSVAGYKTLHAIRDIRNKFAHRIEPMTFDHEDVIKIIDKSWQETFGTSRRQRFISAFSIMALLLSAVQFDDIRIQSLGESHPELYVQLVSILSPGSAEMLKEVLRENTDPDARKSQKGPPP